ncbi:alpha/beta fold hydrolase [Hoyosella rhizosphaerae]|uniref:alpha/beta fold hydrolase n=1 Tax=Hoyosella rhizosphaerae TaxID=1755582 RepID=UPI00166E26F2|nr:alpha/beta fold hydrolase [Hoyosella rhizosphaerae]MBN4927466.1 alpha/beta fold hydrolase [Hoyosella rhizosphaerae]
MPHVSLTQNHGKVRRREGYVLVDGVRLGITEFGSGGRLVILAPSLLLSRRMQEPWARELAERGFHVVCMNNVLAAKNGPADLDDYSAEAIGRRMVGLLDAIGGEIAVFGGTSLGANAALEAAVLDPNRTAGIIVEAPILDKSVVIIAPILTLAYELFTLGRPVLWFARRFAGMLPSNNLVTRLIWDFLSASRVEQAALVQGLMLGRIAPPRKLRRSIAVPALILSVNRDPFHVAADAEQLAEDLPDSQLHQVSSAWTLRSRVRAVSPAIVSFLNEAFAAPWVISRTIFTPNIGDSHLN